MSGSAHHQPNPALRARPRSTAVRWTTGEPVFHHVYGPSRYDSLGARIILDQDDRILHGTAFGKLRVD